jgi:DNA segregation ATPase FtsK/SpoIIIE-like protein
MGNRKNIAVEVGSILVFALGVFSLFSIVTYHSSDPSMFTYSAGLPLNACGRMGAFISSAILHFYGMGAFLLPAALFFIAATIHRGDGLVPVIGTLGGMSVAVSSLTVFLALQWKYWNYGGGPLLTGGAFGAWVSDGLLNLLNPFGSSLVAMLVFSLAVVIATPVSVAQVGYRVIGAILIVLGRLLKLFSTYMLYWLGIGFMRLAHSVGDGLQNLIRHAMKSSRDKVALKGAARSREKALAVVKPAEIPVESTVIGPDSKSAEEDDDNEDSGKPSLVQGVEPEVGLEKNPTFSDEAPNALTDEDLAKAASVSLSQAGAGIKILPREQDPLLKAGAKTPPKSAPKPSRKGQWQLPTVEFLKKPPMVESAVDRDKLISNSQILKQKFADFGIDGEVTAVRPGPVITLYEFKPGPGVKVSRIAALADDLSMALSAQSVRILAPLPGKSVVGIEIPSETRETVYLREFLQHPDFYGVKHSIPVVMGKDIGGQTYLSDLARMPHLLCAGQTGSGKSVFMNGLICSLFYRFTPDELRMILVDPKFIEFRAYQDIPHLLLPVVDDPKQASIALKWAVREMERRYRILARLGARNLASYNQKVDEMGAEVVRDLLFAEDQAETPVNMSGGDWIEAFEPDESGAPRVSKLPYIVVIIDELADLMMIAKKEVEISIARIAQKARAAGIHLVIATQRPSTDVITGLIKANLPSRVSFQLASYVDSKTILDRAGAERLLGQGDMLFIPPGVSQNLRLHGAYLDDDEIGKITGFLKSQGKPAYRDEILLSDEEDEEGGSGEESDEDDALFSDAIELVKRSGHASASMLQRHLKVGYNRAARMIETMESRGIVGPQDGSRPREVLVR